MKEKLIPSAVIMLVCAVVCGLLAAVHAATSDKIVQAESDKVQRSLIAVFGEGSYEQSEQQYEGVSQIFVSETGLTIYDITADGYARGGIRALIGIDADGRVAAVGIVSCGETAGVGTKITAPDYLAKFTGADDTSGCPDIISGATFSSEGLRSAVALALACSEGRNP